MGLWITLRRDRYQSYFRQNLLTMISNRSPLIGNRLYLASGYFQDKSAPDYSILDDSLLASICANPDITDINVIGAKNGGYQFKNFCKRLRDDWGSITIRKPRTNNWHAKIAIK